MNGEVITDAIDRQEWTNAVGDVVGRTVGATFQAGGPAGQAVEDFLHGKWLGHALHPALTDVPLGAWTVAAVLDVVELTSGRKDLAPGADAAVAIGLVGAAGAAVTGLTDWHKTDGKARRIGVVHGLLNVVGTGFFTASWLLRRSAKHRNLAIGLGFAGYAIGSASAWLGGHLISEERISVDHADRPALPDGFFPVFPANDLMESEPRRAEVGGTPIVLVKRAGRIYALVETCSHLGGPLAEGQLEGNSIRCPWHGSRYALDDGRVLDGPSTFCQPSFDVRVRDGLIEVRARKHETAGESTPEQIEAAQG
jgi:nitrite reductase/ring-hydroxylating ferredoxin subunit/uncharacterized membrane protein